MWVRSPSPTQNIEEQKENTLVQTRGSKKVVPEDRPLAEKSRAFPWTLNTYHVYVYISTKVY